MRRFYAPLLLLPLLLAPLSSPHRAEAGAPPREPVVKQYLMPLSELAKLFSADRAYVAVPLERLEALLGERARVLREEAQRRSDPPHDFFLRAAEYDVALGTESVVVEATVTVEIPNDRFHRIPLFAGRVALVRAECDGTAAVVLATAQGEESPVVQQIQAQANVANRAVQAVPDLQGAGRVDLRKARVLFRATESSDFQLIAQGRGLVTLRATLSAALAEEGGGVAAGFGIPACPSCVVRVTAPEEGRLTLRGAAVETVDSKGGVPVEFRTAGGRLDLSFTPASVAPAPAAPDAAAPREESPARGEEEPGRVQAEVVSFYAVGDGRVNALERIRFRVHNVPVSRFAIRLPAATELLRCEAEGIESYRRDGSTLEVRLLSPKVGVVDLALETQTALGTAPVAVLPLPEPLETAAVNGLFGLSARTNIEFTPDPDRSRGVKRVEPGELPAWMREATDRPILHAYRYHESGAAAAFRLARHAPAGGLAACVDHLSVDAIATGGGDLFGRALFQVKNNGLAYLPFAFDGTVEILDASVDGKPVYASHDEGGRFKVRLPDGTGERAVPVAVTWRASVAKGSAEAVDLSAPRAALPVMEATLRLHAPEDRVFFSFRPAAPLSAPPDAPFPFKIVPATLALLSWWLDDEDRAGLLLFLALLLAGASGLALHKRRRAKIAGAPRGWRPAVAAGFALGALLLFFTMPSLRLVNSAMDSGADRFSMERWRMPAPASPPMISQEIERKKFGDGRRFSKDSEDSGFSAQLVDKLSSEDAPADAKSRAAKGGYVESESAFRGLASIRVDLPPATLAGVFTARLLPADARLHVAARSADAKRLRVVKPVLWLLGLLVFPLLLAGATLPPNRARIGFALLTLLLLAGFGDLSPALERTALSGVAAGLPLYAAFRLLAFLLSPSLRRTLRLPPAPPAPPAAPLPPAAAAAALLLLALPLLLAAPARAGSSEDVKAFLPFSLADGTIEISRRMAIVEMADFERLTARTDEAQTAAEAPVPYVIRSVSHDLSAGPSQASGVAVLAVTIFRKGWFTIPLLSGDAFVTEVTSDGAPVSPFLVAPPPFITGLSQTALRDAVGMEGAGGMIACCLEGPGERNVRVRFTTPVRATGNGFTLSFDQPRAAGTRLSLSFRPALFRLLDRAYPLYDVVAHQAVRSTLTAGETQVFEADLVPVRAVRLFLFPRAAAQERPAEEAAAPRDEPAPRAERFTECLIGHLATVEENLIAGRVNYDFTVRNRAMRDLDLPVPDGATVIAVEAPGLERHRTVRTGAGRVVRLRFTEAKLGAFRATLAYEAPFPFGSSTAEVPAFVAATDVFKGYVAVESLLDADVAGSARDRLEPVDPSEARSLPPRRASGPIAAAFAYAGAHRLELSVARHTLVAGIPFASPEARATTAWEANGRAVTRISWLVKNSGLQFLDVTVPPGQTLLSARVNGRPARAGVDGALLKVPLARSTPAGNDFAAFPVELTFASEPGAPGALGRMNLQLPRIPCIVSRLDWLVAAPEGTRVLGEAGPFRRLDQGGHLDLSGFDEGATRGRDALSQTRLGGASNLALPAPAGGLSLATLPVDPALPLSGARFLYRQELVSPGAGLPALGLSVASGGLLRLLDLLAFLAAAALVAAFPLAWGSRRVLLLSAALALLSALGCGEWLGLRNLAPALEGAGAALFVLAARLVLHPPFDVRENG